MLKTNIEVATKTTKTTNFPRDKSRYEFAKSKS